MKKSLKEYRKINGLSQDELSKLSGISIRTIQRIEKNTTSASPFILKSLCKILKIDIKDLGLENENKEFNIENIATIKQMNFLALCVLFIPLTNLILPAIFYWKNKEKLNTNASKILSFQILWTLITITFLLLSAHFDIFKSGRFPINTYIFCVIINIYFIIETSIRLNKSKEILKFVPNLL